MLVIAPITNWKRKNWPLENYKKLILTELSLKQILDRLKKAGQNKLVTKAQKDKKIQKKLIDLDKEVDKINKGRKKHLDALEKLTGTKLDYKPTKLEDFFE